MYKFIFIIFAVSITGIYNAASASAVLNRTSGDWSVFTTNMNGKRVCYIATAPIKASGTGSKPYLMVSRNIGNSEEVSFNPAEKFKDRSNVDVVIDGKSSSMIAINDNAWAFDSKQDADLVQAMRKGSSLTVNGTKADGKAIEAIFSLSGFTRAHQAMRDLCK